MLKPSFRAGRFPGLLLCAFLFGTSAPVAAGPLYDIVFQDGPVLTLFEGDMQSTVVEIPFPGPCTAVATTWNVSLVDADGDIDGDDLLSLTPNAVTFTDGSPQQLITISLGNDSEADPDDEFEIRLTPQGSPTIDCSGSPVSPGQPSYSLTVEILDDDVVAVPAWKVVSQTIGEGDAGTTIIQTEVVLENPPTFGIHTIDWATSDGTATTLDNDYVASSGTVTFDFDNTFGRPPFVSQLINLAVVGDTVPEPDEFFRVELSNPSLGSTILVPSADIDITDDDGAGPSPKFDVTGNSFFEGNAGTTAQNFTIELNDAPAFGLYRVDWTTVDGSANAGSDYVASSGTAQVDLDQGDPTLITLSVPIIGDTLIEPNESFSIQLSNATGSGVSIGVDSAAMNIQNDDAGSPDPTFEVIGATFLEGDVISAQNFTVAVLNAPPSGVFSVDWTTVDGSATAGADYQGDGGTLVFDFDSGDPSSRQIAVQILGDTLVEGNEDFFIQLSDAMGPGAMLGTDTATLNILDDDAGGPSPSFTVTGGSTAEGDLSTTLFSASVSILNPPTNGVYTIDWTTVDSSATVADNDYVPAAGTLTWDFDANPGKPSSQSVTLQIIGDTVIESDEQFLIQLSNPTGPGASIVGGSDAIEITNDDLGTVPPKFRVLDTSIDEGDLGTTIALVTIELEDPPANGIYTVDWTTVDNSATVGDNDYIAASGTVTFDFDGLTATGSDPRGPVAVSQTVPVQIVGDSTFEGDEQFRMQLSNPTGPGAIISVPTGNVEIRNDDLATPATFSVDDVTITEGSGGGSLFAQVLVTLEDAGVDVYMVDFQTLNGTATGGSDYVSASGTITFDTTSATGAPRRGSLSQMIAVEILSDDTDEPDESFTFRLTNPVGGGAQLGDGDATITILDDDISSSPTFLIDDAIIAEGSGGGLQTVQLTITLDDPGSGSFFSVDYATADGSAVEPNDYVAKTGTVVFDFDKATARNPQRTQFSQQIDLQIVRDDLDEADETFRVVLSSPVGATIQDSIGEIDILDDDGGTGTQPRVVVDDAIPQREGDVAADAGSAAFAIRLLDAPVGFSTAIDFETIDLTAVSGSDYTRVQGTATLSNTEPIHIVEVPFIGDTREETDESFVLRISTKEQVQIDDDAGVAVILDDDAGAQIEASINDTSVVEGTGDDVEAVFTVTLSEAPQTDVTLSYRTIPGSALEGEDFREAQGTVTIPAGQRQATISVAVIGDDLEEDEETFFVDLTNPDGVVLRDRRGEATIVDDDGGLAQLVVSDAEVQEGDVGSTFLVFEVALNRPVDGPVVASFTTVEDPESPTQAATPGQDFRPTEGQLTLPPGETTTTVSVEVFGDRIDEPDETLLLRLLDVSRAEIADDEAIGIIRDDDDAESAPRLGIADVQVREGDEGTTTAVFQIRLDRAADQTVTVDVATRDGTAVAGSDYQARSGVVELPPGVTAASLAVLVRGDREVEADEVFFVDLSNPVGAELGAASARGTIVNDDSPDGGGGPLGIVRLLPPDPVMEGDGAASLIVERSGPAETAATALLTVGGGSATRNRDYRPVRRVVRWGPGETGPRRVQMPILDDTVVEEQETVGVQISNVAGAQLAPPARQVLVIVDDDMNLRLEAVGDTTRQAQVRQPLELSVRVVRAEDGAPIEGALVGWSLDGRGVLEGDARGLSDADGLVMQGLALGPQPETATVTARLAGLDAEPVTFSIQVLGDLRNLVGDDMPEGQRDVADILDDRCADASGEFAEVCEYVFGLSADSDRQQAVEALTPQRLAAQGRSLVRAPRVQVRNVDSRLRALRAGTVAPLDRLALSIRGESFSIGSLRQGWDDDATTLRQRVRASLRSQGHDQGLWALGDEIDDAVEPIDTGESPWGFFVNGRVSFGDAPQRGLDPSFDFTTTGVTAGVDYRHGSRWVFGTAVGFLKTDTEVDGDVGSIDTEGWSLSTYASYGADRWWIDGVLNVGRNDYESRRVIELPQPFQGQDRVVAIGEPDGEQTSIYLSGGGDLANRGGWTLGAFGSASWVEVQIDRYAERGGGPFGLEFREQTTESLLGEAGLEISRPLSYSWGVLQPQLRLSFLHEFEDSIGVLQARFRGDPSNRILTVTPEEPDRNFFNLEAALSANFARSWAAFLQFDTDLERDDLDLYTLSGGFRFQF
ncbi:MAG: Calx-beta domain-containing protein [Acidobacteriota bacterium]